MKGGAYGQDKLNISPSTLLPQSSVQKGVVSKKGWSVFSGWFTITNLASSPGHSQIYLAAVEKNRQIFVISSTFSWLVVVTTEWLPWLQETVVMRSLFWYQRLDKQLQPKSYLTTDNLQNSCKQITTKNMMLLWWFFHKGYKISLHALWCMLVGLHQLGGQNLEHNKL